MLHRIAWVVAVSASALGPPASAAKVYRCASPTGETVFSEAPCGKDAREIELEDAPAVPPPASLVERPKAPEPAAAAAAVPSESAAASAPAMPASSPSYRCSVPDGMVFYRHAHCPKHVEVTVTVLVGNVPVEKPTFAPVEETGVSREAACKAIYPLVDAHRYGQEHDQRYSTMERNQSDDPCR